MKESIILLSKKRYSPEKSTWESIKNLNCLKKIQEFQHQKEQIKNSRFHWLGCLKVTEEEDLQIRRD